MRARCSTSRTAAVSASDASSHGWRTGLIKFMDGGNKYAAGIAELSDQEVRLIVRETFPASQPVWPGELRGATGRVRRSVHTSRIRSCAMRQMTTTSTATTASIGRRPPPPRRRSRGSRRCGCGSRACRSSPPSTCARRRRRSRSRARLLARQLDARRPTRRHGVEDRARRVVLAVPAAEVAAVVIGEASAPPVAVGRSSLPLVEQVRDQLRVVDDLEVAAELRVLVLDGVEAVRAGGDRPCFTFAAFIVSTFASACIW